jgi:hypothetical protein
MFMMSGLSTADQEETADGQANNILPLKGSGASVRHKVGTYS